jgi:hypothetical protein
VGDGPEGDAFGHHSEDLSAFGGGELLRTE